MPSGTRRVLGIAAARRLPGARTDLCSIARTKLLALIAMHFAGQVVTFLVRSNLRVLITLPHLAGLLARNFVFAPISIPGGRVRVGRQKID